MTSARCLLPLVLATALSAVPASAASYFYAVGSNNHLYEVSDTGVQRDVRDLSGLVGATPVNGAAFDAGRSQFFFAVSGTGGANASLWYWNQASNVTPVSLGLLPTARPDNGAYWDGAYWYVQQGTHTLHRIALQYDGSGNPTLASGGASTGTLVGGLPTVNNNYFGDIVITSAGTLYATTANGVLLREFGIRGFERESGRHVDRFRGVRRGRQVAALFRLHRLYALRSCLRHGPVVHRKHCIRRPYDVGV